MGLRLWLNDASRPGRRSGRLLKILNVSTRRPLIGIPADRRLLGRHYFHCVGEKYIAAVAEGAQAVPVLIPSLGEGLEARELLADFNGILLTGSPSNVNNSFSRALFAAFGEAARQRARQRAVR
jgi:gamma-glutamyl-gamma-aminobutyrate hydrolase PuuD